MWCVLDGIIYVLNLASDKCSTHVSFCASPGSCPSDDVNSSSGHSSSRSDQGTCFVMACVIHSSEGYSIRAREKAMIGITHGQSVGWSSRSARAFAFPWAKMAAFTDWNGCVWMVLWDQVSCHGSPTRKQLTEDPSNIHINSESTLTPCSGPVQGPGRSIWFLSRNPRGCKALLCVSAKPSLLAFQKIVQHAEAWCWLWG